MTEAAGSTLAERQAASAVSAARRKALFGDPRALWRNALAQEIAERRFFLWLPVAAGAGVVCSINADQEPSLIYVGVGLLLSGAVAVLLRHRPVAFALCLAVFALFLGYASAGWRTQRVAAPVLPHLKIATITGFIEEMDFRESGARFVLRPDSIDGLAANETPYRVRLTIRRTPPFEAGTYVKLKARLLPPAHASIPGGYDFAREAFFARIGAVGNVLGRVTVVTPPRAPSLSFRIGTAIDRARNALARRVDTIVGGEAGAIAAAMVTGKRDYLSDDTKDIIREAGIFHIITISGVQMTLVAGIFFIGFRRLLAMSPTLALRYPIKKWAAAAAILGAVLYDMLTGSRVGTERALTMTVIILAAVMLGRGSLSMRNLAFAALAVILIEPDAILGASFQLSFAAVAALVAVYEARMNIRSQIREAQSPLHPLSALPDPDRRDRLARIADLTTRGPSALLIATFCATTATACFMAYNFHDLSPYVLIGNPLTLTIIELFAVPGALLGTLLYPLGLDAFVWHYVGAGITLVMWAARQIGSWPGSTVHLHALAPWAIVFLALAVLSAVLWRSWLFRASAIPLAIIGLYGAASAPGFDVAIAATGDAVALRGGDGALTVLGHRPSLFDAEQWLSADADGRKPRTALDPSACDKLGCVGILPDGRALSLVLDKGAFAEDCRRAAIIVTPMWAPQGCAAPLIIDRDRLAETGAVTLKEEGESWQMTAARSADEDRPWSRAPKRRWQAPAPEKISQPASDSEPNADTSDVDESSPD